MFSQVKPIKFDLWRVTVNLNQTRDVLNVNDADLSQSHFVNAKSITDAIFPNYDDWNAV